MPSTKKKTAMKGGKVEILKNLVSFERIVLPVVKTTNGKEEKRKTGTSNHGPTIPKSTERKKTLLADPAGAFTVCKLHLSLREIDATFSFDRNFSLLTLEMQSRVS